MTQESAATLSATFNEKLKNNPILAALLLLNPSQGMTQLGVSLTESDLEEFETPLPEDIQLTETLLKNNFNIIDPQVIQSAKDVELLSSPTLAAAEFNREADITINVSADVLKFSLASFAKKNFIGKKFNDFPTEDWWKLRAVGENISLELTDTGIEILVDFQCELSIDLDLETTEFKAKKIQFPLTVEIFPAFVMTGNQIYLSISKGQISLANFAYPYSLAESFSHAIAKIIPYLPVYAIPTQFNLLGDEPDTAVLLTDCLIDENGIILSFHINEDFEDKDNPTQPRKKLGKGATAFLSEDWVGQASLFNYANFNESEESDERSGGHATIATISDFFERNPFMLEPTNAVSPDGKAHYDNFEFVGKLYDWYQLSDPIGANKASGREDIFMAFRNLKFNPEEYYSESLGNGSDAQRKLIDWIVTKHLPVVVLLDMGELTVLKNLATEINEAQPKERFALWGAVYAVNNAGVKLAIQGSEYFIPWKNFMNAWNCSFLPHPNNFYQIQMYI